MVRRAPDLDLDSRRADLDALGVVITAQQRRTGAGRQPWPASIITALQPELRGSPRLPSKFATPAGAEMGRRWSAIAAALLADPDAPLAEGESCDGTAIDRLNHQPSVGIGPSGGRL
jgi:hypothetical protein